MSEAVKILIMEDDADQGYLLAEVLMELGYDVKLSEDAEQAIEILKETPIDVLVTDILVSDATKSRNGGLYLINTVRGWPSSKWAKFPIIAISGVYGDLAVQSITDVALSQGANVFLRKPVTIEELARCLRSVLKK